MKDGGTEKEHTEQRVLSHLKQKGVLEGILKSLSLDRISFTPQAPIQEEDDEVEPAAAEEPTTKDKSSGDAKTKKRIEKAKSRTSKSATDVDTLLRRRGIIII